MLLKLENYWHRKNNAGGKLSCMRDNNTSSPVLEKMSDLEYSEKDGQMVVTHSSAEQFIQSDKATLARVLELWKASLPAQEQGSDLQTNEEISRIIPVVCSYFSHEELVALLGKEITFQLLDLHRTEVLQNLFLDYELRHILHAFNEANIPLLLIKGPVLANTAYPEPGLRTYHDIDALIHPEDLPRAHELLTGIGFNYYEEYRANIISKKRTGYNYTLEQHGSWLEILIELHTAPHPSEVGTAFDVADLWTRAQPVNVLGEPTLTMSQIDHLLYLCWHYRFHSFSRLIWLYDIVVMLRASRPAMDWDALVRMAVRQRQATLLYYILSWCRDLFNVSIPDNVFQLLRPSFACRQVVDRIITPDPAELLTLKQLRPRRILAHRAMTDNTFSLLLACARAFIPEPSILAMRYMERSRLPLRLYFVYYFIHPWITLAKGIRYLFQRNRSK